MANPRWVKGQCGNPLGPPWKKGQSGNPKGRETNKTLFMRQLNMLDKDAVKKAIIKLLELIHCNEPSVALNAVKELLGRVYGRIQVIDTEREDADGNVVYQVIAPEQAPSFDEWLKQVQSERLQ